MEAELLALLKANLTVEVTHASTDPEDDTRVVRLYYGETVLSEASL